jgi:phage tail sheath protein FI
MAERLHPGVYVEEISSGAGPIQGVATSVAAFVGEAVRGMPGFPYFLTSFDDYTRLLGGHQPDAKGFLAQAVQGFFLAGGQSAYAVRVLPSSALAGASAPVATRVASTALPTVDAPQALEFNAKGAGAWSTSIRVDITDSTSFFGQAFNVAVSQVDATGITPLESFGDVFMDPTNGSYFADVINRTSIYVTVTDLLLADQSSVTPSKLPLPERAPSLGPAPNPTNNPYTVYQGTTLTFRWLNTTSDAGPVMKAVPFATAIGAAGLTKTFVNGAVNLTPTELTTVLTSALAGSFRVSADANNVPSVSPVVATKPYLLLTAPAPVAPATSPTFNLAGATAVTITLTYSGTGAPTAQSLPLPVASFSAPISPSALAALITTNATGLTAIARGSTVMISAAHGAFDAVLDVTATGVTGTPYAKIQVTGHGGPSVDTLDTVQLSVSETRSPAVSSFLRTYGVAGSARGFSEGSPASPDMLPVLTTKLPLTGGFDGLKTAVLTVNDYIPGDPTTGNGVYALDNVAINILALPGQNSPEYIVGAVAYCENRGDCFFIADGPGSFDARFDIDAPEAKQFVDGLPIRSENAAIYFPWIQVTDPVGVGKNPTRYIPPSGHLAGIYARTDVTRGVWKAPAGVDATVTGALDVQIPVKDADQDLLNPVSLNCVRKLAGAGIVSWGARTLSADAQWRYVPVRRMALFLKASLKQGLQWAVFEPNDTPLWDQMKTSINSFMLGLFRQGAFQGSKPDDAFLVKCDASTNPQDNIDQGIVTAQVSFAPLKPAEFVVIEISQKSLVS